MARVGLSLVIHGQDKLAGSLLSIADAAEHGVHDDPKIEVSFCPERSALMVDDIAIASFGPVAIEDDQAIIKLEPAPGMAQFVGKVIGLLPANAEVVWEDGWPCIPPRLSSGDPEIDWQLAARLEVLLNGTPRTQVISYDIPARTLTRYATDGRGDPIIEGDKLKQETLHGDVAVRLKPVQE